MELYGYHPDMLSYHRYLNQIHNSKARCAASFTTLNPIQKLPPNLQDFLKARSSQTDHQHVGLPEDLKDIVIDESLDCNVDLICTFELLISGDTDFDERFVTQVSNG